MVEDASEGTSNSGATEDSDSVICTSWSTYLVFPISMSIFLFIFYFLVIYINVNMYIHA